MELNTGVFIRNSGIEVKLGDKLKGGSTKEVVVLYDPECFTYVVQVIENPEFIFNLDEFVSEWSHLDVTGSIIIL